MSFDAPQENKPLDPEIAQELQNRGISAQSADSILKGIANRIVNNEQLCAFLLTVDPARRKEAYEAIAPKLLFTAQSYITVMNKGTKVARKMKRRLGWAPRSG